MALNTYRTLNTFSSANELIAESGAFVVTGFDATLSSPKDSEIANSWFNGQWWVDPTWGTTWWGSTNDFPLFADSGTFVITGTDVTLITSSNVIMVAESGSIIITGTDAALSTPLVLESGTFEITGTDVTFQVEYSSPEFVISKSGTFDGKGIIYGTDIAYNTTTDIGYTVLERIDVDSLFLDGIFGSAPQPFNILKYVGKVTVPSIVVAEFDGENWKIESSTPIGL